jgi:hypothetical protein
MFVKRKVLHVDGKTTVIARGLIKDGIFKGQYKFEGMWWGCEIEEQQKKKPINQPK